MDDMTILGRDDERHSIKMFLAHYDVPAYVRRALQVEEAFEQLLAQCRKQREEMLSMVRTRIGVLKALAKDWGQFQPWLKDDKQVAVLLDLHTLLQPQQRFRPTQGFSWRTAPRALRELCDSIHHFNRRWEAFLQTVDLTKINDLRAGYNRYYLVEKECALRSVRLARQGFRPLEPLTVDELAALLPSLPVPRLADQS
jgi:hypothetical protein